MKERMKNSMLKNRLLITISRSIHLDMQTLIELRTLLPVPNTSARSHILAINKILQGDSFLPPERDVLEAVRRHFEAEQFLALRDSSRNTIAQAVKRQLIKAYPAYRTELPARFAIDEFFRIYRHKVQTSTRGLVLSPEQTVQLASKVGERTYVMICFLSLGLRVSEMTGIRTRDIVGPYYDPLNARQYADEIVLRICGKGKSERDVLVPKWILDKAFSLFEGKTYLFETASHRKYSRQEVYALVTSASKRLLGFKVTPHDFRKTFGTHMSVFPELMKQTMSHGGWRDGDVYRNHYVLVPPLRPNQIPPIQAIEQARVIRDMAS